MEEQTRLLAAVNAVSLLRPDQGPDAAVSQPALRECVARAVRRYLVDLDTQPALVVTEVAGLRIFAGYAGWSPGQLEGEIETGSWYVVDTESADIFTDTPDVLWRAVLRRQPEPLRWVAWFPADPTAN